MCFRSFPSLFLIPLPQIPTQWSLKVWLVYFHSLSFSLLLPPFACPHPFPQSVCAHCEGEGGGERADDGGRGRLPPARAWRVTPSLWSSEVRFVFFCSLSHAFLPPNLPPRMVSLSPTFRYLTVMREAAEPFDSCTAVGFLAYFASVHVALKHRRARVRAEGPFLKSGGGGHHTYSKFHLD